MRRDTDVDLEEFVKRLLYIVGLIQLVYTWYVVSIMVYVIGLRDYGVCGSITGNTPCNSYYVFMVFNFVFVSILGLIPSFILPTYVKGIVNWLFFFLHVIFLSYSHSNSDCRKILDDGCSSQAFQGTDVLFVYSMMYLVYSIISLLIVLGRCCCDNVQEAWSLLLSGSFYTLSNKDLAYFWDLNTDYMELKDILRERRAGRGLTSEPSFIPPLQVPHMLRH